MAPAFLVPLAGKVFSFMAISGKLSGKAALMAEAAAQGISWASLAASIGREVTPLLNGKSDPKIFLHGDDCSPFIQVRMVDDVVYAMGGDDIVHGSHADDIVFGGEGNDILGGFLGDDKLYGGIGDDFIHGHEGNDWLYGGVGNDFIDGGIGKDVIRGEDGIDFMRGQEGNDILIGGNGDDYIWGGDGNDKLYGGAMRNGETEGNDELYGGAGDDIIWGHEGNDELYGQEGNDRLDGGKGDDILYGGEGDDVLLGGRGNDQIFGGEGADTFLLTHGPGHDQIMDFTLGEDLIEVGSRFYMEEQVLGSGVSTNIRHWHRGDLMATVQGLGVNELESHVQRGEWEWQRTEALI